MRRRLNGRPKRKLGDTPTAAEQIEKAEQQIVALRERIDLLRRLPDWAVVRTARTESRCDGGRGSEQEWLRPLGARVMLPCEEIIEVGKIYVQDPRYRQFGNLTGRRLCLKCAPFALAAAAPSKRRITL